MSYMIDNDLMHSCFVVSRRTVTVATTDSGREVHARCEMRGASVVARTTLGLAIVMDTSVHLHR